MNRRDVIAGLLVATAVGRARSQESAKHYRIAILEQGPYRPPTMNESNRPEYWVWRPFFAELSRLGYVEGENLTIERYWGGMDGGDYSPDLARKVVASNPNLIFANNNIAAHDLVTATSTIPIIAWMGAPVRNGLVANVAHPEGNLTGVDLAIGFEVTGKRLQLLRELVPQISKLGYLTVRAVWESTIAQLGKPHPFEMLAKKLGVTIVGPFLERPVTESEIRHVFAAMSQERVDALYVGDLIEVQVHLPLIVRLVQEYRLPAISFFPYFVEIGGLIAYANNTSEMGRIAADQIDQVLKGKKPSDIPIYRAEKFTLAINLKTAYALGLTVPPAMLAQADEVIE
jgi:putative tryptophan/tyrosine transport system substrate-binding protein